jgi:hypothetical protein
MNPSKFSLDYLKPTESSTSDSKTSDWENAAVRILQEKGSQNVQTLFNMTANVLSTLGALDVPKLEYNEFAQMIEDMIKMGKLSVVQGGAVPTAFVVSLPKPA